MSQQQINITLDKTTELVCNECNNNTFTEVIFLRKASRFVTGTQQDAIIPITVFSCSKCGHVNEEFIPIQLKKIKKDDNF